MQKGIITKAAVVSALSLLIGVACSHNHSTPAASSDAQLEGMAKQQWPTFSSNDATLAGQFSTIPTVEGLPTDSKTGKINPAATSPLKVTVQYKTMQNPVDLTSLESVTLAKLQALSKSKDGIMLYPSDDDMRSIQGATGQGLSAKVVCESADCSRILVLLITTVQTEGDTSASAAFTYVLNNKGEYAPEIQSSAFKKANAPAKK